MNISQIFHLNTGQAVLDYLAKTFPQCDLPSMVGMEQAEDFARSKGGFFPKPQYCRHFQQVLPNGKGGVVLIGDAIHSFPPVRDSLTYKTNGGWGNNMSKWGVR